MEQHDSCKSLLNAFIHIINIWLPQHCTGKFLNRWIPEATLPGYANYCCPCEKPPHRSITAIWITDFVILYSELIFETTFVFSIHCVLIYIPRLLLNFGLSYSGHLPPVSLRFLPLPPKEISTILNCLLFKSNNFK